MKIAIIYTSSTGNTAEVAHTIHSLIGGELFKVNTFNLSELAMYDAILVGSYTWGNGEIPREMTSLYEAFSRQELQHVVTGVFGTGDRFYPKFCGAVDLFRDKLALHTSLAVTLKVEQMPQNEDIEKCRTFVNRILTRLEIRNIA
ncbi:flavodoxin domain-containing protein [Cytobacillus suaedae]|nr:flavodoxin domain-containing protein [Cytobacillus suaedae]